MAGGDVQLFEVNSLLGDNKGHRASKGQYPHDHAGSDGVSRPPPSQGVDGIHNSEQPVQANARYKKNRTVHVPVKSGRDHTTHQGPEYPVVAVEVVEDLEWEHDGKEQVGSGQVQHVDGRRLLGPDATGKGQHGADVDRHADNANQSVERRYEDGGNRAR